MKHKVMLGLALMVATSAYSQAPQRRPVRPALRVLSSQGIIALTFVPVPNGAPVSAGASGPGTLQVGPVSGAGAGRVRGVAVEKRSDRLVVRTRFGIRLEAAAPGATGDARLSAFLLRSGDACAYVLDGIVLSDTPAVIAVRTPIGTVTEHVLEMEIPSSAPEGVLVPRVGFIATLN